MIAITNRARTRVRSGRKLDLRLLKQITAAALEELGMENAELGIVLVGAKEMASINEKFLGHEGPTDVITFDYSEKEKRQLHGEVFVCVEVAEQQAKEFGTSRQSEVIRYIVHGILHLAGHDDLQPAARRKMKQHEGRLVRKLSRGFALSKL
jgi:probable rRNA maturation factor